MASVPLTTRVPLTPRVVAHRGAPGTYPLEQE
jgi:glycerophosphoryl diester phosphodiesterase